MVCGRDFALADEAQVLIKGDALFRRKPLPERLSLSATAVALLTLLRENGDGLSLLSSDACPAHYRLRGGDLSAENALLEGLNDGLGDADLPRLFLDELFLLGADRL